MKMKKWIGLFLLICVTGPAFAKEEPASLVLDSWQEKSSQAVAFPFEFSLEHQEWIQGKAGKMFSIGTHSPDFILPSLREDPVPVHYPRRALQRGWEGSFVIAIEVLPTGEVGRWQVMKSTGYSLLDEAAIEAVRQWRFHPATEQGKAVASCIQIPIHFKLQE